jgi:hypothetical protein
MKKKTLSLIALLGLFLVSCTTNSEPSTPQGGGETQSTSETSSPSSSSESSSSESSSSSSEETKEDFTDAFFDSASYVYDGSSHILNEVRGAPEGTTITYTGRNSYTNVGTYNASARLEKEGYNPKTLNATLTITRATFSGYTYESKTVRYDGAEHINDIQLVGVLPQGTTTNQVVRDSNNNVVNSAINVGIYNYTCTITNSNYNTLTLNAQLTIKAEKKDMPVFVASDGNIYFPNGLHNDYLYCLNSSSELNLIDYSTPKEFSKYNSSTALFISSALTQSSVKEVNGGSSDVLYTDSNIDNFVKESDSIYYYASNSLKAAKSGIYKVDATDTDNEPIVTKIYEGKTKNLALYNGYLYFSNSSDHNYLYKLNTSTSETTLVMEEKVHEFTIFNNRLFCTVNGLLNDYIGYLNLSSSSTTPTKLTNAAGEFLTIKNGYLYYNYTDLFSSIDSSVKGIWRIGVNGGDPEQLLATDDINGFDVESNGNLVYIDTRDLHLYRYNVSSHATTDLLDGFVAPETTPYNTGGRTMIYSGTTYYLNMYADKTLYSYNSTTNKNVQLTTNKVADFYIAGSMLYYNLVTIGVNNDLYCVDLQEGGEATKINSNDVREMTHDGTYLYGVHYNWAGAAAGLCRMKLDGTEYVKFSEVNGAKNLSVKDEKLYYINCASAQDNGYIEYINLSDITTTSKELEGTRLSNNIKNVKQFAFDGDNIFYIFNGTIDNSIRRTDFTSLGEGTKIASSKTNPSEFILYGNYVYYYSYAVSALNYAGFYRVSKTATADGTQELLAGYESTYYATALATNGSQLFFLNYIPKLTLGDAHFYVMNLSSKAITKIC